MTPASRAAAGARRCALLTLVLAVWIGAAGPAAAERAPSPPPAITGPVAGWPEPDEVSAQAWLLLDADTGQVLAEHGARVARPVASTVKVLTAMTVLDRAELDEVVDVGDEVDVPGASVGLSDGDAWTVEQLLDGLLLRSGNDAAHALATHVAGDMDEFVELMAADAASLGIDGITLADASGLDDGNRLSAADLATIARVALDDPELAELLGRATAELPGVGPVTTRNELLEAYPGATGVKTGFTEAAGLCLVASAERDGRELVAVVLASAEDPARFDDAATLLDHGFEAYESLVLDLAWRLPVAGGEHALRAPPSGVVVPAGATAELDPGPLLRPEPGPHGLDVVVDDEAVGVVGGEVGEGPPEAGSDTAALGRALADEVHAGLRAATAAGAW